MDDTLLAVHCLWKVNDIMRNNYFFFFKNIVNVWKSIIKNET